MAEQNTLQFPADVSKGEEPLENMDPVPEGATSSLSTSENDKKTSEQAGDENDESDGDKQEENKKTSNLKQAEITDGDQSAAAGEIQTTQPGGSSQSSHPSLEKTETNDSTNQQQTAEKENPSNTSLNGSDDSGQNREPNMDPEPEGEADNSSKVTEGVSKQAEIKDVDQRAAAGETQATEPEVSRSQSSLEKAGDDNTNEQQTEEKGNPSNTPPCGAAGEIQTTQPVGSSQSSHSSSEKTATNDSTNQQQTGEKENPSNTSLNGSDDSGQNREPDMDPEPEREADSSSEATERFSKQAEIKDRDQSAAAGETQVTQPEVSSSQSSLKKAGDDNTNQQQTKEKGNLSNTPPSGAGDSGSHIELPHPSLRSRSKYTSTETKSKADSAAGDENERAKQQEPVTKMENIKGPGHHTYLIMAGVVILAFSLLWWIVIQQEPSSQQDDKRHIDIFLSQLEKLKNQFSNQRPELWSRSKIHLKRHLELAQPTEPVSLILTAGVKAGRTLHCLAQGLATAFSSARNGSVLHISGASRANQDSDAVKLDIDSQLREAFEGDKHVAVIHRFEELPPGSTLIFYRYCDHENAAYKKTFLLFTVLLGEEEEIPTKRSLSAVEEMVDDHLRKKFLSGDHPVSFDRMDIDKYGGLWSRISHLILPVMSEEKMEQVGC